MRLYFAYGSNMSRQQMARRCPGAGALGVARLDGWEFLVMRAGYASVRPRAGGRVWGVLWHLAPRHVAALDLLEGIAVGAYTRADLPVRRDGALTRRALVYLGAVAAEGPPKPGYLDNIVLPAARAWRLPQPYVASLERWLPGGFRARGLPPGLRVGTWDDTATPSMEV